MPNPGLFMSQNLYALPRHVLSTRVAQEFPGAILTTSGGPSMHDPASELLRILLPRTPVNKGMKKKEGPGLLEAPVLMMHLTC